MTFDDAATGLPMGDYNTIQVRGEALVRNLSFIKGICMTFPEEDREDAGQEISLRMLTTEVAIKNDSHFRAICVFKKREVFADFYVRGHEGREARNASIGDFEEQGIEFSSPAEENLEQMAANREVIEKMALLHPRTREILSSRAEGRTLLETARSCKIRLATVHMEEKNAGKILARIFRIPYNGPFRRPGELPF
jgi:DNA-directed RNA polymerase specialized sigma24 family protein